MLPKMHKVIYGLNQTSDVKCGTLGTSAFMQSSANPGFTTSEADAGLCTSGLGNTDQEHIYLLVHVDDILLVSINIIKDKANGGMKLKQQRFIGNTISRCTPGVLDRSALD